MFKFTTYVSFKEDSIYEIIVRKEDGDRMYDLWVMFRICVPLGLTIVCGKNKHCNRSLLL